MESIAFLALAPPAFALMVAVGVVAWRRRRAPGGWALVAFTAAEVGWLALDVAAVLAPGSEATVRLTLATYLPGPLLGPFWVWFVLSYIERFPRPARLAVGALAAWSVAYAGISLANEAHGLVWATWGTVPDGPFRIAAYTLGPLAKLQTGFMWAAVGLSLGVMLWAYARAGARSRDLSRWLVVGALVPLGLNVMHLTGVGPVQKDFTPIAMAVSSGAFALGLVRYRFLDLRPLARAALVDALREGMLVLDADGVVVDANPALRCALGAEAVAIGRPLRETAPALAAAIAVRADDASEGPADDVFHLGTGPDGRAYDLRVSPLAGGGGAPSGRLVLLHDVTRRRAEQAALRQANADLYHANAELQARNDELDAFAHTVAHDLKNSVQGVMGWAEILRDDGPELPAAIHRELAGDVVASARKMGTVVHELLLLAGVRKAAVEPRPVDMAEVVAEALGRLRQSGTPPPAAMPEAWPVALGYAPWLEEVWLNYLTNAHKYGGPTVTLGADPTADGRARFWVHDDGPGLAPEAQAALFVPFTRVGSLSVEGHGLGLSIVRRIAERLDGTCGVESAPGWGTRFWFALPLAEAVPQEAALARA